MARDTRAGSSHLHFVLYENLRGGVCYNAFLSGFLAAEIKMGIAEIIFVRVPLENLDVKKISHLPSHISCPSTISHMSVRSYTIFIPATIMPLIHEFPSANADKFSYQWPFIHNSFFQNIRRRTYISHLSMDKTMGRSVPASSLDIGTMGGHVLMSYWSVHWTNIRIWTSACTCEEWRRVLAFRLQYSHISESRSYTKAPASECNDLIGCKMWRKQWSALRLDARQ